MQISSTTSELSYAEEGTDKRLACVIRVKDDSATTLLVNIYDELGRITGTTKGDVTVDYEYDKESRVTKESKYYKGLYQGCSVHEYTSNNHAKTTSYAADGKIIYDGETYDEFFNSKGQLVGKSIYSDEVNNYTNFTIGYDKTSGWIINEYLANRNEVLKELKHSYKVSERGNLVETVTDGISGKVKSETTYMGDERLEDKILQYEEYDPDGNLISGYENEYAELNGRYVHKSKTAVDVNSVSGKIKADVYFYSTSEFSQYDDIYEYLGMKPNEFSGLTVHMVSSGYDDVAVTYGSSGSIIKTVTSKKDDSGRVIEVREISKSGALTSVVSFEYDKSGNCCKMIVEEGDDLIEYIFGYISVQGLYGEPFSCADAEKYIDK